MRHTSCMGRHANTISLIICTLSFSYNYQYFVLPYGESRSPYLGEAEREQPQEQRYPFLPACAIFSCVQTLVWLTVFETFSVITSVDARDRTTPSESLQ